MTRPRFGQSQAETQVVFHPDVPPETRRLLRNHPQFLIPRRSAPPRQNAAARALNHAIFDLFEPGAVPAARDAASREHGRYLVPEHDLGLDERQLLGRTRQAQFALTHTRLGADGLTDRDVHIAQFAQLLWKLGLDLALITDQRMGWTRSGQHAPRIGTVRARVSELERAAREVVQLDRAYQHSCATGPSEQDSGEVLDQAERQARRREAQRALELDLSERANALIAQALTRP